ncbi:MAG: GyrI-like domain-containing protein [Clostridia bacterium]|nr:GyrI-like domain-containing protein [Clostridia bacterium]
MLKDIISMPETTYLGLGIMMPWENNLDMQFAHWKEAFASGKVDQLKKICGSDRVLGIFCYRCDMEAQTFSYHIACENKRHAASPEFEELRLEALTFARFERSCTDASQRFSEYHALCEEIWRQWLANSSFISLIEPETCGCVEGYASLEIYTPENPTAAAYTLEMLLPVAKKQDMA